MLADLFKIQYHHPERTPIQLKLDGNQIHIDCRFHYNQRALRPDPASGRVLADEIEAGIIQYWSGSYELDLPGLEEPVDVCVTICRDRGRRSVPIRIRHLLLMPAHVISPFYRRFWGLAKTGQLESIGTNWSLEQPGCMILPVNGTAEQIGRLAAHEAGHLFGLGDAYAAIYRFYYAVPETGHYMMHSNTAVQPEEILMLLRAHETGRMQFFPRKWSGRQFIKGLHKDIEHRAEQFQHMWNNWRERGKHTTPD